MSDQTHKNVIVLGAGIAGLATAWALKGMGIDAVILEQSSHVGGCIRTVRENGYLLELGPNTFLNSATGLWELASSAGLKELKIETPEKVGKKRYIFKNDSLCPVPAGPKILFSPILSLKGRLRILKEPFVKPLVRSRERSGAGLPDLDESLASFVTRRLGHEVLDTLVTPFVSGIYAGDPERLSVKAVFPKLVDIENRYGGIFKGMKELKGEIKSSGLGSFKAGMGTLSEALAARLKDKVIRNARVVSIERLREGFNIRYELDSEPKSITAGAVISALPSYSLSSLISNVSSELSEILSGIEYSPVVVVHTGHRKDDIKRPLDGFGYLVPRKNRVRTLGCLFSSSLFPGRAPEGKALLTNFLGGMLDPEAIDLSNDDIMRMVTKDLERTLGIRTTPDMACITRYAHAIPQYNIGHTKKIARMNEALKNIPGLFITGSYFNGVSVSGTIEHAKRTAERAAEHSSRKN